MILSKFLFRDQIHIGVIGSRSRNSEEDYQSVKSSIIDVISKLSPRTFILVSGGCKTGADSFVSRLDEEIDEISDVVIIPPCLDGVQTKYEYATACYQRNGKIADLSDVLVACWDNSSGGTKDTINKFTKHKRDLVLV